MGISATLRTDVFRAWSKDHRAGGRAQGTGAFGPHRWRADSVRKDSDSHTRRELATAAGPHPSLHHAGMTPYPSPRGDAAHTHPTPSRPPLLRAFSHNSARSYVHT